MSDAFTINTATPAGAPEAVRAPFPVEALPPVAADMVKEARRAFGVEADLPAGMVLACAAAAIGKGLKLEIQGQVTPANLFIIMSGRSGCGKSESARPIWDPLHDLERETVAENASHEATRNARKRLLEAEARRIEKASGKGPLTDSTNDLAAKLDEIKRIDKAMIPPRLIAENVTTEKLAIMLQAGGEQIAVLSPDCGEVVQNLRGRYTDGKEDESLLLKAFSGDPVRVDRVMREAVTLTRPCITLCLIGTPDILTAMYGNARFRVGGFLPRCLPVASASVMKRDDGTRRGIVPDVAGAWNGRIRELFEAFHNAPEPSVIQATSGAEQVFRDCHNAVADAMHAGSLSPALEAFAARKAEQAKRLALSLHALAHGSRAADVPLAVDTAKHAVSLAEWFYQTSTRLLSDALADEARADADKLAERIERTGGVMTLRDLKNNGGDEAQIRRIVAANPGRFEMTFDQPTRGGRPSVRISLQRQNLQNFQSKEF